MKIQPVQSSIILSRVDSRSFRCGCFPIHVSFINEYYVIYSAALIHVFGETFTGIQLLVN